MKRTGNPKRQGRRRTDVISTGVRRQADEAERSLGCARDDTSELDRLIRDVDDEEVAP